MEVRLSNNERIAVVWRNHKPTEIIEVEELAFNDVEERFEHYQWRAARVEDYE